VNAQDELSESFAMPGKRGIATVKRKDTVLNKHGKLYAAARIPVNNTH